jgi:predicted nucleic acid-binding protein
MATRWAYFDTSVVVKRYIQEPGSEQVRRLLRRNQLLSSTLTPVEIVSALCRRRRQGDLSSNALAGILRRVTSDCAGWELVEVNGTVLDRARELLQGVTPLRTLDAIQIASLITFQAASALRVPLITADSRQREVAVVAGIDVISIDLV